jgi:hypothetical protein
MLGAAVAWATTPPARGGQAVAVIPATPEPAPPAVVGAPAPLPAPPMLVGPVTTQPIIEGPGDPATPSFTVVQMGNTVVLDASASPCNNGGCDFSWRLYRDGGNRLGSTMGFGPVLTYTLPAPGIYQVVVTESEYCVPGGGSSLRSCPGTAQQTITIT